jgi:isoamylase
MSINYVTRHDGFTLRDLVSYKEKHNEANGEGNRDGVSDNHSWNCGAEGPTTYPAIVRIRSMQQRNFLASLLLSAGVPMLLGGDELGHSQQGNNNPYCQDNEVSWIDWDLNEEAIALLDFTKQLVRLRAAHPVFRRRRSLLGKEIGPSWEKDVVWFTSDAVQIDEVRWRTIDDPRRRIGDPYALGMFLNGRAVFDRNLASERIADDSFMLAFNGGTDLVLFTLPNLSRVARYELIIDTNDITSTMDEGVTAQEFRAGESIRLTGHSMVVLRAF